MKVINIILTITIAIFFVGCTSNDNVNQSSPVIENNNLEKNSILEETPNEEPLIDSKLTEVETVPKATETTTSNNIVLFENSYRDFNTKEFNLAKESNYYIVLDFYSNWCPSCKAEDSLLKSSFNDLKNVIIFKVNYGDSETSKEEKELADNFEITNRASGIILKGNKEISRYSGHKSSQEYEEILNSLN